jgi:glycine cleavage system H protein
MQGFGVVESVKAVSDLFAPLSGEVVEVNETLKAHPERVNQDPYGDGWLIVVSVADQGELAALMSAADYDAYVATAGGH